MCGGRGTRLDVDVEKPLFEVGGRPMIERVQDVLAGSRVDVTYAVVSPHAPATRAYLDDLPTIETPGEGYVADLEAALADDRIRRPVLTVAADLPLLAPEHVDAALDYYSEASVTVCVPAALKRLIGVSVDEPAGHGRPELTPVGLNVVGGAADDVMTSHDARLAINVNRLEDARVAEALL